LFAADSDPGTAGTVVAVMLLDAADAGEFPTAFVAITVNVYAVADCRPVTDRGDDAPDAVYDPGEDVTV
jgi:hypothetical protein